MNPDYQYDEQGARQLTKLGRAKMVHLLRCARREGETGALWAVSTNKAAGVPLRGMTAGLTGSHVPDIEKLTI